MQLWKIGLPERKIGATGRRGLVQLAVGKNSLFWRNPKKISAKVLKILVCIK
jgi:hypothetical protein